MTLRELKWPLLSGLSFFSFNQARRWLGIELPDWMSALSAVVAVGLLVAFVVAGRRRERFADEYLTKRFDPEKFEDDVQGFSSRDTKDSK
ncbi:MAG: hypothetical protein ACKOPE_04300 [Novosphingobium sp.]